MSLTEMSAAGSKSFCTLGSDEREPNTLQAESSEHVEKHMPAPVSSSLRILHSQLTPAKGNSAVPERTHSVGSSVHTESMGNPNQLR